MAKQFISRSRAEEAAVHCSYALLEDRERRGGYTGIDAPRIGPGMGYLPGVPGRRIRVYHNMDVRLDLEALYAKLQINYPFR